MQDFRGEVCVAGEGRAVPDVASRVAKDQARFWSHVDKGDEKSCWVWTGHTSGKGYGYISIRGGNRRVHRVVYEWEVGPIPEGLQIDHLCRNRLCVNPAHLEAVTNRTNTLRGMSPTAIAHRTNRCKHGHTLSDARITKKGRDCRTCHNLRDKKRKAAQRAAAKQAAGGAR